MSSSTAVVNARGADSGKKQAAANVSYKSNKGDLFIRVTASKSTVYEQEPVLLTYKVYTLVDLTQLEGKMPELNGFHSQEIPLPQQKVYHTEKINGINYRCVTWSQFIVYPQTTGKLEIPSIQFNGIVIKKNHNADPFDAFFGGSSALVETKREVIAPSISLNVLPLPKRPEDFSGGVGNFSIKSYLDKQQLAVGESATLKVVVSGHGNLKLINEPTVSFPEGLEHYDVITSDNIRLTSRGSEGSMIFEYTISPQKSGNMTIPPVYFTYFDTSSNKYKTISSQPLLLKVAASVSGDSNLDDKDGLSESDNAIHDILRTANVSRKANRRDVFFLSTSYFITLFSSLILVLLITRLLRKRRKSKAEASVNSGEKSYMKLLRGLDKLQRKTDVTDVSSFCSYFYAIMSHYFVERIGIDSNTFSASEVKSKLIDSGCEESKVQDVFVLLECCEQVKFSHNNPDIDKAAMLSKAKVSMASIEDFIKNGKIEPQHEDNNTEMVSVNRLRENNLIGLFLIVTSLFMALPTTVSADNVVSKSNVDNEYSKGHYKEAAKLYEQLLKTGENSELYYNLGNSYYQLGQKAKAIVAWERALLLDPHNKDAKHNLEFISNQLEDKFTPKSNMFFVEWHNNLRNNLSVDEWAWISIFLFIASVVLFCFVRISDKNKHTRLVVTVGFLLALLFADSVYSAYCQYSRLNGNRFAIVMSPRSSLRRLPSTDSKEQVGVHEGCRLEILDSDIDGWTEVMTENGIQGWIENDNIENI